MATPLKQLGASEIDTKIAQLQFCERLCLVKTSSDTDFAFTPGRAGPDQTVSVNKLWPALKFNGYNELMDQLNMKDTDPKAIAKIKAKFTIETQKLLRKAGISLADAGFAYLLGKGDQSSNFLTLLRKNDSGELVEDGVIFDFFNSMIEMEMSEGYCASSEFQHAFKIAMTRMEAEQSGDDVMLVNVANVNSAKKTSAMEEQPKEVKEDRKGTPRRTSPRKKKPDFPVQTVEFAGKEANASDTSSCGIDFPGEQDNDEEGENQAGKKSPKGLRASPVADGVMDWTEMWNSMTSQGWTWVTGNGLVDRYYVHPNFANRKKAEIMTKGKEGEDYFVNEESVMRYAKKYLGFRGAVATPASNSNYDQRRGRKRTAAVVATTEPIIKTKKEKKKNSKSGKKQSDKKSTTAKKHGNETKGKKKTKIYMHSNENESVGDGSHFSRGGFGPSSPTISEAEIDMGVQSAQKRLTYRSKQHTSTPETAAESVNSRSDYTATDSASSGAETLSDDSEVSSADKTFQVMSSVDAWKLLMEHFEFKYHKGMYCLPGNENKPGKDSCAIEGRHYFPTLIDLRKHLCAYGIPQCKKFLAYADVEAVSRWVRFAHVQKLQDGVFVNPEDVGGYLDFRRAWSMLQKLGLTWNNGFYIIEDPDPMKEPKKFENQEEMCVHLARFGIPPIRSTANAGLSEDDRLRLDLWITSAKIDSL